MRSNGPVGSSPGGSRGAERAQGGDDPAAVRARARRVGWILFGVVVVLVVAPIAWKLLLEM